MYELKNLERYLQVNLLGPGPCLIKKEFTGPRSHKGWETLTSRTETFESTYKTTRCPNPKECTLDTEASQQCRRTLVLPQAVKKHFIITWWKIISLRRLSEWTSISLRGIPHVAVGCLVCICLPTAQRHIQSILIKTSSTQHSREVPLKQSVISFWFVDICPCYLHSMWKTGLQSTKL